MDFVFLRIATQPASLLSCFEWDSETQVRQTLRSNPEFLFSLYLASSPLFTAVEEYLRSDKSDKAMLHTLYKYVSRNTHRATPFGNFAGVGVATLAEDTQIHTLKFKLHAELDIHVRKKLFETLKPSGGLLYSNSSLSYDCGYYTYFELLNQEYHLSRIKKSPLISRILARAQKGLTQQELLDLGADIRLIEDMTEEQLLVSAFCPSPADTSADWLTRIKPAVPVRYRKTIENLAEQLLRPKLKLADLQKMSKTLHRLVNQNNLFYINCSFEAAVSSIKRTAVESIKDTLNILEPLFVRSEPPMLTQFRQQFYKRYGDAEIPLLQALDPESGIMYGHRQEHGFEDFLNKRGEAKEEAEPALGLFTLQKALWSQALRLNLHSVELDIKYLPPAQNLSHAATQYAMGELIEEDTFLLKTLGGATAHTLMARFSGLSPLIKNKAEKIVKQDLPAVDLIYLPPGREGNVALHPPSGRPQLPYLTSGSSEIHISEVMVAVRDGSEIVLSHKGQQIKVLVPTAHNYHKSLPVCRFLGDVQYQGNTLNFSWNWGVLADEPFLPRVTYKNTVLTRAIWNTHPTEKMEDLLSRLPEEVLLKQGDNELYLNLALKVCKDILQKEIKKHTKLQFIEITNNTYLKKMGHHAEVVIPLIRRISKPILAIQIRNEAKQWLYFKLYARPGAIDQILCTRIPAIVRTLGVPWFFVRFEDHLRIRFLIPYINSGAVQDVLRAGLAAETRSQRIYSIESDRYFQENDRYIHMEQAEGVFYRDSEHTLRIIKAVPNAGRMDLAISKIQGYLEAVGLLPEEQKQFCIRQRDAYLQEQADPKVTRQTLNSYSRNFTPVKAKPLPPKLRAALAVVIPDHQVLASLIHMSLNRLFVQDQRALEMLAYHLLWKKLRAAQT